MYLNPHARRHFDFGEGSRLEQSELQPHATLGSSILKTKCVCVSCECVMNRSGDIGQSLLAAPTSGQWALGGASSLTQLPLISITRPTL